MTGDFMVCNEALAKSYHIKYEKVHNEYIAEAQQLTPWPSSLKLPSASFTQLSESLFSHPIYRVLQPYLVPAPISSLDEFTTHPRCVDLLSSHPMQCILGKSDLSIPTLTIPWKRTFIRYGLQSKNLKLALT